MARLRSTTRIRESWQQSDQLELLVGSAEALDLASSTPAGGTVAQRAPARVDDVDVEEADPADIARVMEATVDVTHHGTTSPVLMGRRDDASNGWHIRWQTSNMRILLSTRVGGIDFVRATDVDSFVDGDDWRFFDFGWTDPTDHGTWVARVNGEELPFASTGPAGLTAGLTTGPLWIGSDGASSLDGDAVHAALLPAPLTAGQSRALYLAGRDALTQWRSQA